MAEHLSPKNPLRDGLRKEISDHERYNNEDQPDD
jgi:hypothetical protein